MQRLVRTVATRRILQLHAAADHLDDTAEDPAIADAKQAARLRNNGSIRRIYARDSRNSSGIGHLHRLRIRWTEPGKGS